MNKEFGKGEKQIDRKRKVRGCIQGYNIAMGALYSKPGTVINHSSIPTP